MAACGGARSQVPSAAAAPGGAPRAAGGAAACQAAARAELVSVARRIRSQAASGRNVVATRRRLRGSAALAAAVARGDARATRRALAPLVLHQVVRIEVFHGTRRLVSRGRQRAFSPTRVTLRHGGRVVGSALFAVTGDRAFTALTQRLTGAPVILRAGGRTVISTLSPGPAHLPVRGSVTYGGVRYATTTLHARAYPSGPLSIALLVGPAPRALCGASAADTRLRTVGYVAKRLLAAEQSSGDVARSLRYVAHLPAFRRAAASGDPVAIRAAIVRIFRNHRFHIVRVRLQRRARLLLDVGGPYVLAPASAAVRGPGGAPAGRFTLSVQDDTGYIKLVHRFTGAAVQLRTPRGLVPGSTLEPGPASIPAQGAVSYAGRSYRAVSFTGTAFPSGPLRISLLLPAGA
jgi:hypothetical protein